MRVLAKVLLGKHNNSLNPNVIPCTFNVHVQDLTNNKSHENNKMNPQEMFLFDLNGFIVIRNVLNEIEVEEMNTAIDEHMEKAKPRWVFVSTFH